MTLKEYIFRKRIKKEDFANLLGVSASTVEAYIYKRRRPIMERAKEIQELTEGKVTIEELRGECDGCEKCGF